MEVLLFGVTRDIIGGASLNVPVDRSAHLDTVGALRDYLGESYPELNKLSSLAIAVNNTYARDEQQLNTKDSIALIPPVSGG